MDPSLPFTRPSGLAGRSRRGQRRAARPPGWPEVERGNDEKHKPTVTDPVTITARILFACDEISYTFVNKNVLSRKKQTRTSHTRHTVGTIQFRRVLKNATFLIHPLIALKKLQNFHWNVMEE